MIARTIIGRWFRPLVATVAGIAALWALFYTFALFPWERTMQWWQLPHLFTLIAGAAWVAVVLVRFIDNGGDNE